MLRCLYKLELIRILSKPLRFIGFFLLLPVFSYGAQWKISWDPNVPAPDGYRVYLRTVGGVYDFDSPIWTGKNPPARINIVEESIRHYIVVRAFEGHREGQNSDEVFTLLAESIDPDNDGLSDAYENKYNTNPGNPDSDGDGIPDGNEIDDGTDPLNSKKDSLPHFPTSTTYEDAEDGKIEGWSIYDNDPDGAKISNVYDQARQSRVIQLAGSGTGNGFRLRKKDGKKWNNTSHFVIQWSMKFSEEFTLYVEVKTTSGKKFIQYNPIDRDLVVERKYIKYGIDSRSMNGQWHTFTRDLQADLHKAYPDVSLLAVNSFLVRGSGKVDDINLYKTINYIPNFLTPTTYEDAEDGKIEGWSIYDNDPDGAKISNVYDQARQSRVIQLAGSGTGNGFRLRKKDGKKWNNTSHFVIQWSMKFSEEFTLYVEVKTTSGKKFIQYNPIDRDLVVERKYIKYGIDSRSMNGQWHTFTRDLQADLHKAYPDVSLLAVNSFLVRGSGKVDDINLYKTINYIPNGPISSSEYQTKALTNAEFSDIIEFGEVKASNNWIRVNFNGTFTSPVVVAGPISLNDQNPAVIRIRNVEETGFEMRLQEWNYLNGKHPVEKISYLVVEKGRYTLEDDTIIEATNISDFSSNTFRQVLFEGRFNVAPVVLTSITSTNDTMAVTGRISQINTDGFHYKMQEQQANKQNHGTEKLSFIAWEPSLGVLGGWTYLVDKTTDAVTHLFYNIFFDDPFASSPAFLAKMQTSNSFDFANVRYANKDEFAIDVLIHEEQSADEEIRHGNEVVGYMVFGDALDSDQDSLSDVDEIEIYSTDPDNPDSDGDGITDGDEVDSGTDPNRPDQ